MASLKEVKARIQSVISTQQITKAMKMVAAAKLRRAQDRIVQLRPYSEKLSGILANLTATLGDDIPNLYGEVREVKRVLIVVVTSDRGLCGAFNTNVHKAVLARIESAYAAQHAAGHVDLLCLGSKGRDFFKRRGYRYNDQHVGVFADVAFDAVREAAEYAMEGFVSGKYDAVDIVFNEFRNVATQSVKTQRFLPALPASGEGKQETNIDYLFEPSKLEIVTELIPKALKIDFYRAVLESNASEHGARMTAMDKATENANELLKELKLTYNRTRQAAITTEILEIVGGAEALANG
jgi:F-type H+-transporting ATPase subunit gamma